VFLVLLPVFLVSIGTLPFALSEFNKGSGSESKDMVQMLRSIGLEEEPGCHGDIFAVKALFPAVQFILQTWPLRKLFLFNFQLIGATPTISHLVARTRWIDEKVLDTPEGSNIVLLGSGYDTRAYRLDTKAQRTFYDLDLAASHKRKQGFLSQHLPDLINRPNVHFLDVDFRDPEWHKVLAPLKQSKHRTLFILEGVFYYLPVESLRALFKHVASLSKPGDQLIMDALDQRTVDGQAGLMSRVATNFFRWKGEPFLTGLSSDDISKSESLWPGFKARVLPHGAHATPRWPISKWFFLVELEKL